MSTTLEGWRFVCSPLSARLDYLWLFPEQLTKQRGAAASL